MTRILILSVLSFFLFSSFEINENDPPVSKEKEAAIKAWQDMKFGMFIHWGPVSLRGTEIGWSRGRDVPIEEYDKLCEEFNPVLFDAEEWVKVAKDAGMKYLVITTKHHDGFCLWDSEYTDHDMSASPFKKDILKELSDACRKEGIQFGTYYSVCDWYHPDFPLGSPAGRTEKENPDLDKYIEYLRNQVKELILNYGPLYTIWFDVPQKVYAEHGVPTVKMVNDLQPDILINNRAYRLEPNKTWISQKQEVGDYSTPEQRVGSFDLDRPWETCMTICRQWAWKPNDELKSYDQCIETLLKTAGGGGNLLFNVGPMPDGRIEQRQIDRLKEMGEWLEKYGESVYETTGGPYKPTDWISSTRKGNKIYIHLYHLNGSRLLLPSPGTAKVKSCSVMHGNTLQYNQTKDALIIDIPETEKSDVVSVIEIELKESAMDLSPIEMN